MTDEKTTNESDESQIRVSDDTEIVLQEPGQPGDGFTFTVHAQQAMPGLDEARGGDTVLFGGVGGTRELGGRAIIKSPEGDVLVCVHPTGDVQFGESFDERVAVRSFWQVLGALHPLHRDGCFVAVAKALKSALASWDTFWASAQRKTEQERLEDGPPVLDFPALEEEFPNWGEMADDIEAWIMDETRDGACVHPHDRFHRELRLTLEEQYWLGAVLHALGVLEETGRDVDYLLFSQRYKVRQLLDIIPERLRVDAGVGEGHTFLSQTQRLESLGIGNKPFVVVDPPPDFSSSPSDEDE
jgi:hypothetical protein